jgi:hypothetical protein
MTDPCPSIAVPGRAISVKGIAKRVMPGFLHPLIPRLQRYFAGCGWRIPPKLGPLPSDAGPELTLLYRAWELAARSEGNQLHICYYSMAFDGFALPGERPWGPRWDLLSRTLSWKGARVLELGCNIGLLSTFAVRAGAADALAVDCDDMLLEANRMVQQAFHVNCPRIRCDFNQPNGWEEQLAAFKPTIVTALSVLHWVAEKERFLRFLGRFETVLYEGHDSEAVERRRLEWAGFKNIQFVGRHQYNRPVFVARAGVGSRTEDR